MPEIKPPPTILLADDDENDAAQVLKAIRAEGFKGKLNIVDDGENLLAYLEGAGNALQLIPDLILLDVRMQPIGGIEVLKKLKSDSRWAGIPKVIISGLLDPNIIEEAYRQGAEKCLLKPLCGEDARRVINLIPQPNSLLPGGPSPQA